MVKTKYGVADVLVTEYLPGTLDISIITGVDYDKQEYCIELMDTDAVYYSSRNYLGKVSAIDSADNVYLMHDDLAEDRSGAKKCTCELFFLMNAGCKCGGV